MSLSDLLPAIRALPRSEKAELLHLLVDEVTAPPKPIVDDGIPEELRKLLPPPGTVIDFVWPTTTDAAGHVALAAFFPPGATFEVATPPDGFEAAEVLQQLLDAEKSRP